MIPPRWARSPLTSMIGFAALIEQCVGLLARPPRTRPTILELTRITAPAASFTMLRRSRQRSGLAGEAMRKTVLAAMLVATAGMAHSAAAAETVGLVKTVEGSAFVVTGSDRVAAAVGTAVHQDDVIETAGNGSVGVTFKDNTTISVGPDTTLAIDEFVFAPEQDRYAMKTRMLQGTMYYVSGTIAKLAPEAVSVATPVGTIGIRGTRFLVKADAAR
jgi:hypothetical protein